MQTTTPNPDLNAYDWVVVSTSGGKDSQAMLDLVVERVDAAGVPRSRVVVVHADLGRVEWPGTRDLVVEHAGHYGLRLEIVSRPQGDLLAQVRRRRRWPSPQQRYCTSDHKRDQINKVLTRLARESGRRPCRILQCWGFRADESPARARRLPFSNDKRNTNGRRRVDVWLPIHEWTVAQVWDRIRAAGTRHHEAYDAGMPRLSCSFCIFAPKSALMLAGRLRPDLLAEYVEVEREIGHTFRVELPLAQVQAEIAAGAACGRVDDWRM